jgi:hypothetical protein
MVHNTQGAYKVLHSFGDILAKETKNDPTRFASFNLYIEKDLVGNSLTVT